MRPTPAPLARLFLGLLAVHAASSAASAQHGGPPIQPGERRPELLAAPDRPPAQGLELVVEIDQTPGNIAVSPDGRVFLSMHPFGSPGLRVVELPSTGGARAYPTPGWAGPVGANGVGIQSIIGIHSDADGVLWMLDAGNAAEPGGTPPKLVAWDTRNDRLVKVIHIPPPASRASSFLQDFVIDSKREAIVIADCGIGQGFENATPALVVVHTRTGASRRVLENAACVRAEPEAAMVIDGVDVQVEDSAGRVVAPRVGVNPITMDREAEWIYFGAMHGTTVWRIKASHLLNPALGDAQLVERIERYGSKGVSDGISIDAEGNLYVTDVASHSIGVLKPDRTYELFLTDERLQWPDGMAGGPDGNFYLVVNQLHRHPLLNRNVDATKPPFAIYRFRGLAPAIVGR